MKLLNQKKQASKLLTSNQKQKLRSAIKEKDGWWASIFSGPLANRFLEPICDIKWISPNLITISSFVIGVCAALCFTQGSHEFLLIGAILVQLSFIVDCMDGQLARYRQQFSNLGAWLDRVSDRVKDFLYFFSLAWGFYHQHDEFFSFDLGIFKNLFNYLGTDIFRLPLDLQVLTLKAWTFPSWYIWPLAMTASFTVFLIDYYCNQDMKLEALREGGRGKGEEGSHVPHPTSLLSQILKFGLQVYRRVPILRFNIGEQALILSIFTACNLVFSCLVIFAGLGIIYSLIWPVLKLKGYK